jgi:DNA-binding NarL/FixJ family response regulator
MLQRDPFELSTRPELRPWRATVPEGGSGPSQHPGEPARILIVEDDYLIVAQMELALTEAGFEVAGVAASGERAIELAASRRPALVVMDVRLAGERDGVDAALELFRQFGIRCIFATAHHDDIARRRASAAAPLAWLPKPYGMARLVETVRRALHELGREG